MHFANLLNLIVKNIQRVGMTKNKEITYTVIKTFFIFFCMQEIGPGLFDITGAWEVTVITGNNHTMEIVTYMAIICTDTDTETDMDMVVDTGTEVTHTDMEIIKDTVVAHMDTVLVHMDMEIIRDMGMSSGGSCSTHEECGEQTVCSGGSCVAAHPGQKCSSQSECGPDSPCRYGRCWSPAASGDGSTGNQCNSSDQCEEHEICASGTCSSAVPSTTKCSGNEECPGGGCKFDYCWFPDGAGGGNGTPENPEQPNQNQRCSSQADCGANQICSDVHKNLCTDGYSLGIPCTKEGDCDKKDVCKDNVCWREGQDNGLPANERCTKQDECKANTVCEDEKCQNAIVTTKKCLMQMNCKSAEACRFGYCWSVTNDLIDENNPMTPCKTQADCGPGTICSDIHANKCMKAHTTTVPCKKEKDCYKKDVCKDGECWVEGEDKGFPPGTSCTKDEQCTATAVCEGKICKLATRTDKTCRMEFSCGKSSACKYGYCWNVEAGGSEEIKEQATGDCTTQADCGPDEICSDIHKNKCYKAHSIGTPCTKEKDCSKKDVCKDGTCWKEGTDRGAPVGSACRKDNECAATLVCEKDECRQGILTTKKCTFEASCGKRAACRYSYCWNIA
ncbi:Tenascin-X [Trichinella sp. T8]|nr:Tenascin-X [Trichinella sp. T8]